jgi:hypothetical protein
MYLPVVLGPLENHQGVQQHTLMNQTGKIANLGRKKPVGSKLLKLL